MTMDVEQDAGIGSQKPETARPKVTLEIVDEGPTDHRQLAAALFGKGPDVDKLVEAVSRLETDLRTNPDRLRQLLANPGELLSVVNKAVPARFAVRPEEDAQRGFTSLTRHPKMDFRGIRLGTRSEAARPPSPERANPRAETPSGKDAPGQPGDKKRHSKV